LEGGEGSAQLDNRALPVGKIRYTGIEAPPELGAVDEEPRTLLLGRVEPGQVGRRGAQLRLGIGRVPLLLSAVNQAQKKLTMGGGNWLDASGRYASE
jgi:hypothetical protein